MTDSATQYTALTTGVGIADVSGRTQVEIAGADRATFLHNLCTNDIKRLAAGEGCEAFLTNVQGKVLAHVLVFCRADSLILETVPGAAEGLLAHLDHYLIREDVQLVDRAATWGELLLGGAKAESLLAGLIGAEVPRQPLSHVDAQVAGSAISLRRVELTGPSSFLLGCTTDEKSSVMTAFQEAGATLCESDAVEQARVEAGWPLYGRDISDANLPQEVGRNEQAISFTKGCYLGQEIVARIDALGHVNRTLVGLKFPAVEVPPAGMELTVDDVTVGRVTSAVFSPRLESPLALAYVRREHHAPGSILASKLGDAEIVKLPFS